MNSSHSVQMSLVVHQSPVQLRTKCDGHKNDVFLVNLNYVVNGKIFNILLSSNVDVRNGSCHTRWSCWHCSGNFKTKTVIAATHPRWAGSKKVILYLKSSKSELEVQWTNRGCKFIVKSLKSWVCVNGKLKYKTQCQWMRSPLPWRFPGGFICVNEVYCNPIYITQENLCVRLIVLKCRTSF